MISFCLIFSSLLFLFQPFRRTDIGYCAYDEFILPPSMVIFGAAYAAPGSLMTPPPFLCRFYHSGSSKEIKVHLPEHGVNGILDHPSKPGPKSIVVEMRDSKILLNNITDF